MLRIVATVGLLAAMGALGAAAVRGVPWSMLTALVGPPPLPPLTPAPAPTDGPRLGRLRPDALWRRASLPFLPLRPALVGVPDLPAGVPPPLLPPNGTAWLPTDRIVSYYGNPLAPGMGVLGQHAPAQMVSRLDAQAAAYAVLDPAHPVVPALELVADVAQGAPGPNGHYRMRMPYALISQELALARRSRALLILDLQVGRSTVAAEVPYFRPFLAQPDVELALDPEFDMPPGEVPGRWIGTMSAASINWAGQYLANLEAQYRLPQKILIVHQFTPGMVPDWRGIRVPTGVQFIMDTDGFGGAARKEANYRSFITDQPVPPMRYGGIKLFYQQDVGLMSPQTVLSLAPAPSLVIYQ